MAMCVLCRLFALGGVVDWRWCRSLLHLQLVVNQHSSDAAAFGSPAYDRFLCVVVNAGQCLLLFTCVTICFLTPLPLSPLLIQRGDLHFTRLPFHRAVHCNLSSVKALLKLLPAHGSSLSCVLNNLPLTQP